MQIFGVYSRRPQPFEEKRQHMVLDTTAAGGVVSLNATQASQLAEGLLKYKDHALMCEANGCAQDIWLIRLEGLLPRTIQRQGDII